MERYRRLLQIKRQEELNIRNAISASKSTSGMSDWGDDEPTEAGRSFGGENGGYGDNKTTDDGAWGGEENTSNGGGGNGRRDFGNRNGADENVNEESMRDLLSQNRVIPLDFEKETIIKFIQKDLPQLQSKGNYIEVLCAQYYLKHAFKRCLQSQLQKQHEEDPATTEEASVEMELFENVAPITEGTLKLSHDVQKFCEEYFRTLPQIGRQDEAQLSPERLVAIDEKRRKAADDFWRQEQNEPDSATMLQRQLRIRRDREERGFGDLLSEIEPHNENFTIVDLESADRRRLASAITENGELELQPRQRRATEPVQATAVEVVPAETFHISLRPRPRLATSQQLQNSVSSAEETESVERIQQTPRSSSRRQQRSNQTQHTESFMRRRTEFSRFTTVRPIPQRSTLTDTLARRDKGIGLCYNYLGEKADAEWEEFQKFKQYERPAQVTAGIGGGQAQAQNATGDNEAERARAQQTDATSQVASVLDMRDAAKNSGHSSGNLPRLSMQPRSTDSTPASLINRKFANTSFRQVDTLPRQLLDSPGGIVNENLQQQNPNTSLQSLQSLDFSNRETSTPIPQMEQQQGQTGPLDLVLETIIEQCETESDETVQNNQVSSLHLSNVATVPELPPLPLPSPTPTRNNIGQPNDEDIERPDWFDILRARTAPVLYRETRTHEVPNRRRRRLRRRRAINQNTNNQSPSQFINPLPGILPEPPMPFDDLPQELPPIAPTAEGPNFDLAASDAAEAPSNTSLQPHLPLCPSNDVSQACSILAEAQHQHENFLLENAEDVRCLTDNADLLKKMITEYAKHCDEGKIEPNHFSETYDPEIILQMDSLRLNTKLYMLEELCTSEFFDFHRLRRLETAEEKAIAWEFLEDLCRCDIIEIFDEGHKVSLK